MANFRGAATADPEALTIEEAAQAFEETLDRIDEGYESGALDDETADALDEEALADYQALLSEQLGIEIDDDEDEDEDEDYDEGDYADGTDLATFSSGTQLGATLLELGQAEGYDTVEDLIEDLSAQTGFDPNDLADVFSGQATMDDFEDPELAAHTLAKAFSLTADDETAYEGFMTIAAGESGYDVEDGDSEEDAVDYSRYRLDLERDRRVNHLEAQFSAAQETNAVQSELMELVREADLGCYEERWLPPAAYRAIIGNFEVDSDRFAAFSSVCDENQVDAATELYAMRRQLEAFKRCGPFATFGATVAEDLDPNEAEAIGVMQASAKAYAKTVNASLDL